MKKLFISIFTCVFALFALGTSTFAWFAMNTEADATGMAIQVNDASGYLIIASKTAAGQAPTVIGMRELPNKLSVDLSSFNADAKVNPTAYDEEAVTDMDTALTAANWLTKIADDPSSYACTDDDNVKTLTTLTNYVLQYDLYFCVAEGSKDMANLTVSNCTIAGPEADDWVGGVKVLIASEEGVEEFSSAKTEGTVALVSEIAEDAEAPYHLVVLVFIDGENEAVYTNNFENICHSISIELLFTAEDAE